MSECNKGGRGKRNAYQTTHVRVPSPIKAIVESLSNSYKAYVDESSRLEIGGNAFVISPLAICLIVKNGVIAQVTKSTSLAERWNLKSDNDSTSDGVAWVQCSNKKTLAVIEKSLNNDFLINTVEKSKLDIHESEPKVKTATQTNKTQPKSEVIRVSVEMSDLIKSGRLEAVLAVIDDWDEQIDSASQSSPRWSKARAMMAEIKDALTDKTS